MELYQAGNLAKSLAGHDKDRIYVILREEKEQVYVVDGKFHTVEKPKRKRKKHVQPIYKLDTLNITEMMSPDEQNQTIRRVLKQYQECNRTEKSVERNSVVESGGEYYVKDRCNRN